MKASEKYSLDRAEGLGEGYAEREVEILSGARGVTAQAYYATDKDLTLRPYNWYKAIVLAGAREHRLPDNYVAAIESVISIPDPDEKRAAANAKIALGRKYSQRD